MDSRSPAWNSSKRGEGCRLVAIWLRGLVREESRRKSQGMRPSGKWSYVSGGCNASLSWCEFCSWVDGAHDLPVYVWTRFPELRDKLPPEGSAPTVRERFLRPWLDLSWEPLPDPEQKFDLGTGHLRGEKLPCLRSSLVRELFYMKERDEMCIGRNRQKGRNWLVIHFEGCVWIRVVIRHVDIELVLWVRVKADCVRGDEQEGSVEERMDCVLRQVEPKNLEE